MYEEEERMVVLFASRFLTFHRGVMSQCVGVFCPFFNGRKIWRRDTYGNKKGTGMETERGYCTIIIQKRYASLLCTGIITSVRVEESKICPPYLLLCTVVYTGRIVDYLLAAVSNYGTLKIETPSYRS